MCDQCVAPEGPRDKKARYVFARHVGSDYNIRQTTFQKTMDNVTGTLRWGEKYTCVKEMDIALCRSCWLRQLLKLLSYIIGVPIGLAVLTLVLQSAVLAVVMILAIPGVVIALIHNGKDIIYSQAIKKVQAGIPDATTSFSHKKWSQMRTGN